MFSSRIIAFIFLLLPFIEIATFIVVGKMIGVGATLLLIVVSMMSGVIVLRTQGFSLLLQVHKRMQAGEPPALEMFEGALLVLGGLLMIIPGLITSLVGLLLIIPPCRRFFIQKLMASHWVTVRGHYHQGRIIEGEFRQDDDRDI